MYLELLEKFLEALLNNQPTEAAYLASSLNDELEQQPEIDTDEVYELLVVLGGG